MNRFSCGSMTADRTPANALMSLQHQLCNNREVNVDWLCPVYASAEWVLTRADVTRTGAEVNLMLLCHQ